MNNFIITSMSPVVSTLINKVDENSFERIFSVGAKFAGSNKDDLLALAKLCHDRDPMLSSWIRALRGLNKHARAKLIKNLLFNHMLYGANIRDQQGKHYSTHIPFLVLISPTYACNLRCKGCYSALYGDRYHFEESEMIDILQQFYDLGVRFFTLTGGEPFVYPSIMRIFEKFNDCYFMVYTNGTLLTESRVKKLAKLGNVATTISIEGWEEMTDWRRGEGVFKKIVESYHRLHDEGLMCGASIMATRKNHDQLMNDDYWRFISELGVEYVWVFQYMPIGRDATFDLVPTPQQRYERFHKIEQLRLSGQFAFIADFWNHGFLVNGCMSGGANYLHINAKGGVEPCVFQQYAVDNIREKSVIDVLHSPFFEGFKQQIPFNTNLMQPCPIIDNPGKFREHILKHGAKPQHEGSDSYFKFSHELDELAQEWKKYAIKIWDQEGYSEHYKAEIGQYR
ncbi:radical SAM protein [Sodalis sp. RH22]|uniref:radical SAM protein n=1 Tax=unclassified Sodalis (in: enterobacteria) TaxID=2636512 RepID=UPI0039B3C508